jgi:hypothetical protein
MPRLYETAYPRFKTAVTEHELQEIYAPSPEELAFAEEQTRSATAKVGRLVLLKTFQRLGRTVRTEQKFHWSRSFVEHRT